MKTRDQLRAERAAALVAKVSAADLADYLVESKTLPAMVQVNGLGPALAFLKAKGGSARAALFDHVSAWVGEVVFNDAKGDLLAAVIKHPAERLMRAHEETIAFVAWLKRFAEAKEPKARKA
jgi:CRISPR type III-B/RAMP module-associated protein Cmr5